MRILILSLVSGMLVGCVSTFSEQSLIPSDGKLIGGKPVIIATSRDGADEKTSYENSGRLTSNAIYSAVSRHTKKLRVTQECSTIECLKNKFPDNAYYVIPEILLWEDRSTEFNGKPDRIEIKISIYRSSSSQAISSTILSGQSKRVSFGGDRPQDLLEEPVNAYIDSLY